MLHLAQVMKAAKGARKDADMDFGERHEKMNWTARYFVGDLHTEIEKAYGKQAGEEFLKTLGFEYLLED